MLRRLSDIATQPPAPIPPAAAQPAVEGAPTWQDLARRLTQHLNSSGGLSTGSGGGIRSPVDASCSSRANPASPSLDLGPSPGQGTIP